MNKKKYGIGLQFIGKDELRYSVNRLEYNGDKVNKITPIKRFATENEAKKYITNNMNSAIYTEDYDNTDKTNHTRSN